MGNSDQWERSMRHVRTTNQRVQQMKALGGTGSVRTISLNPKLFAGYQQAMKKVAGQIRGKVMGPREKFNALRKEMGNNKSLKLGGRAIHHFKFSINKYGSKALNPGNLLVNSKNNLRAGSMKPGHVQLHQIFGGKNLGSRAQMFGKMAWGKQNAIQRHFSFMNRGDRVPLDKVKGKIQAFNNAQLKQKGPGGKAASAAKLKAAVKSASAKPAAAPSTTKGAAKAPAAKMSGSPKMSSRLSGTGKMSGAGKLAGPSAKGPGGKGPGGAKPSGGPPSGAQHRGPGGGLR